MLALYVDPDSWDLGVGGCLMEDARALLAGQGFTEAIVCVLVNNDRAERFYRTDGWLPDGGRRQDDVWGVSVDEVRYGRR